MRARRMLVLAGLLLAPATAAAQTGSRLELFFFEPYYSGDSVYGATAGGPVTVTVAARDYNVASYALGAFTLRLYFDPSRLSFVSARSTCPDSAAFPLNAPVSGPNYVELSAAGCGSLQYFEHNVLEAHFQLAGGAVDGSTLLLDPVIVSDRLGTDRTLDRAGDLTEVCHSSGVWGDVDGDALVNSRDALIALSSAVGLPSGGFDVSRGDVDADGLVTSRDALAMLSASIGLSTSGFRVGKGIVDVCAPEATFPSRALFFVRDGVSPGVAGSSGLAIRAAGGTAVTVYGDSADTFLNWEWRPRVSPDGNQVLFICLSSFGYPNVCKVNSDGSGVVNLTNDFTIDQSPDWSPAGDSIVFVTSNQIWIMDSAGLGAHVMPGSPTNVQGVAWQPVFGSRTVAYTNVVNNGQVHTVSLDDILSDVTVYAAAAPYYSLGPRWVDWNVAGDSLVFDVVVDTYYRTIAGAPAVAGGPLAVRLSLFNQAFHPNWTDAGVLFVTSGNRNRMYVWRPDGSIGVIGRDAAGNRSPGMKRTP